MVIISLNYKKCIGCNYCVEVAPKQWRMSKKDGKVMLINGERKKDYYILKSNDNLIYKQNYLAQKNCPVKIIQVKKI